MQCLSGPKSGSAGRLLLAASLKLSSCVLGVPAPSPVAPESDETPVTADGGADELGDSGKAPSPSGSAKDAQAEPLDAGAIRKDAARELPLDAQAAGDAASGEPADVDDAASSPAADTGPTQDEDARVAPPAESDDAATSCSIEGTFAAEVTLAADWKGTSLAGIVPLLKAGSGAIRIQVRLDMRSSSASGRSTVTVCSAIMPDFAAGNALVGTEQYSPYFLDSSWEQPTMPRWDLGWEFKCLDPGCAFSTEPLLVTLGARTPSSAPWPGRMGPISQISGVDSDQDGRPGLAIYSRTPEEQNAQGVPYAELPVTWTLGARATQVDLALQLEVQFDGKLTDCDSMSADIRQGRVEARALGCLAHTSSGAPEFKCSEEQRAFVDENIPTWMVRGGSARVARVARDADCNAVRDALN